VNPRSWLLHRAVVFHGAVVLLPVGATGFHLRFPRLDFLALRRRKHAEEFRVELLPVRTDDGEIGLMRRFRKGANLGFLRVGEAEFTEHRVAVEMAVVVTAMAMVAAGMSLPTTLVHGVVHGARRSACLRGGRFLRGDREGEGNSRGECDH
jgi:hypothetical protein